MTRHLPLILLVASASSLLSIADAHAVAGYRNRLPGVSPQGQGCVTCHINPNGGGSRNAFGEAFRANGHVWNAALASLDSDNDGYTNGQELGDPAGNPQPNTLKQPGAFISLPGALASTPCGNGAINPRGQGLEACDGADFGGLTCADFNATSGQLSCTATCTIDSSACVSGPVCGDGVVEAPEVCDEGQTPDLRCDYGEVSCVVCDSQCQLVPGMTSTCGDQRVDRDAGERCDGAAALDNQSCLTQGFDGGQLACDNACAFDTTACTLCGDGIRDPGEQCDGDDLNAATCTSRGFAAGQLACDTSCRFDTTSCEAAPEVICGDGIRQGDEACDGDDLDGQSCQSLMFGEGALGCAADCTFDASACVRCGDGVRQGDEACDGDDLGDQSCVSLGFDSGPLTCASDCTLVIADCREVIIDQDMPADMPQEAPDQPADMPDMAPSPDMDAAPTPNTPPIAESGGCGGCSAPGQAAPGLGWLALLAIGALGRARRALRRH